MIAIKPVDCTAPGVLVSTNATDAAAWSSAVVYAINAVVSRNQRNWKSVQGSNINNTPETSPLWWVDDGPANTVAMFDTSVRTATTRSGGLSWTMAVPRATAVGLMGVVGATATITVRNGSGGAVLFTDTQTLQASDGSYYGFCFEELEQRSDVFWTGLPGSVNSHITVSITGTGDTSCGLCVIGKQVDCGQATYGFSVPIEDRGTQYLDRNSNPVTVERGYSRGCQGTLYSDQSKFNRLMRFYSENINTPCLWIAAPGISDLVSASVFGKISRVVPVIANPSQIVTNIEIAGYR